MARIISPSLLKNVDVNKKVPPEFDLGMDDFVLVNDVQSAPGLLSLGKKVK